MNSLVTQQGREGMRRQKRSESVEFVVRIARDYVMMVHAKRGCSVQEAETRVTASVVLWPRARESGERRRVHAALCARVCIHGVYMPARLAMAAQGQPRAGIPRHHAMQFGDGSWQRGEDPTGASPRPGYSTRQS